MSLTQKHCVPCEGGLPPLNHGQIAHYSPEVPDWKVSADEKKITKEFKFKDFTQAMAFVNKVAALAEEEGHHPDIHIFYTLVRFELTTHAMKGLSENDFILAAKINALTAAS
jgi:4a-hydroxytetrahydrobiopterin dehydratase